jgi:hypothetical protein
MSLASSILVLAAFILLALHYWREVAASQRASSLRPFWNWVGKGVCVPILWWVFFNSGLWMPPLIPQIEMAPPGGGRVTMWVRLSAVALLVIASYWAGVTFFLLAGLISSRVTDRKEFFVLCAVWSVPMVPIGWLILHGLNWAWAGFALFLWLWPIVHTKAALVVPIKRHPTYSRATARVKFGKYAEAEWAVIQELETCEDDVEGWLMLAELYARHHRDLTAAEKTIHETCGQPNITPSQIGVALHRLADWHLNLADDPVAARKALEQISRRFPGTHLDKMARLRASQLPASQEELREQRKTKLIHLPALHDDLHQSEDQSASRSSASEAAIRANKYVDQLTRDPDNASAREGLARLFAEPLEQVDLAIEQVRLLLEMPDQPPSKRAEWLSLIAAWQIRYRNDPQAALETLRQIVVEYPQSPQAFAAQRRLNLMDAERRVREGLIRFEDGSTGFPAARFYRAKLIP